MKCVITCTTPDGQMVERVCFSVLQAFTIINILQHEGCKDFGTLEENE